MTEPIAQQLADLLGRDAVLLPDSAGGAANTPELEKYAVDGLAPQVVVQPADRESIARLMQWAAARQVAVLPRGGGVMSALGNRPARVDVVLDLSRYNRVLDYQPADLTVTVEPGVTLQTLSRELARGGKFVPLEAPLSHRATIGGILAANASGPLRHSYGLARDWLIGISVVGADGVETKAGGKVVKNVTGYDLNKLYTGSLGTLGVIVEASFKLAPLMEEWAALVAPFPSMDAAIAAGRSLIAQVYAPQGLQVVNRPAARRLNLTADPAAGAYVLAFFAGRPRAVGRRREESARLLGQSGATEVESLDGAAGQALLRQVTDLGWSDDTVPALGMRVNLPPTAVGQLVAAITGESAGESGADLGLVADLGFGVAHLLRWPETFDQAAAGNEEPTGDAVIAGSLSEMERVRTAARSLGGTVVVEHCAPAVKARIDVWGGVATEAELEIMRRIKQNFDPLGLLNPGRFMGRL